VGAGRSICREPAYTLGPCLRRDDALTLLVPLTGVLVFLRRTRFMVILMHINDFVEANQ